MFSNFSYLLKRIINDSKKEMQKLKHSYIGTEHFFLALLNNDNKVSKILNNYGVTYNIFKQKVIENIGYGIETQRLFIFTPLFKKVLEDSIIIANESKIDEIDVDLIIKLIIDEGEGVAYRILCDLNIEIDDLYDVINNNSIIRNNNLLAEYGTDLTEKAMKGFIDPVIGRDKELNNIINILLRKNKCNPLLIGDAGVGKTAIVEHLAERIIKSNVPNRLLNKKIISISIASLVAGTKYRGEFEEKLLSIIKEIEKNDNYIIFIDEIHTLMGAGGAEGAVDASNILKPALSRGNIKIIGATTKEEYRKFIEDDKAFSRRFQKILIEEPNDKELLEILKNIKSTYENYHNVIINNNILNFIIKISKKYLNSRKEPDRSIDLLDEVSSLVASKQSDLEKKTIALKQKLITCNNKKNEMININNYNNALKYRKMERKIESKINTNELNIDCSDKKIVDKKDVLCVISNKYNSLFENDKELNNKIKNIINEFKENGSKVVNSIKKIYKYNNNKKPTSMIFNNANETLINKIGNDFFNNKIIKIDLNEFSDEQSYTRIVGSPPGYVGYNKKNNIFENIKEQPFNLIVINNYDKACIKVKNLIKDIINKGFFLDYNGYRIDFINSLIIINYNIKNTSIGFNKKETINCDLSNYVTEIINFDKTKVSMI